MSNVLIIGNGFDRQLGLKTDYISFLDWIDAKGEYFEEVIFEGANMFKEWLLETNHEVNEEWIEIFINIVKNHGKEINGAKRFLDKIKVKYHIPNNYSDVLKTKGRENIIRFLLPLTNRKIFNNHKPKTNLWFSYFNYLRRYKNIDPNLNFIFKEFLGENGQWIDLETLIEKNIISDIKILTKSGADLTILNFAGYVLNDKLTDNDIKEKLWNDFKDFKLLLAEYIKLQYYPFNEGFNKVKGIPLLEGYFFHKVINFNYTNFYFDIHTFDNNSRFKLTREDVYNVHGVGNDKENIVFGFDSFFTNENIVSEGKSQLEIDLLKDKDLVKYSKIQQLLELQKDKPEFNIGIVDKLSILGHSIGEQDYNYFFSIMDNNIDRIKLEYLWYRYNDNQEFDNRQSGQEALFNMINAYEKYANKRVFHKMIFEGRIKFREVPIPKII